MSGPLAKAALVEYQPTWPLVPVVTVFQYNPESMVHTWTQAEPPGQPGTESGNPLTVPGMPGESFEFTIFLDADDDITSGVPALKLAAEQAGLGARLAALEMLLYPTGGTGGSARQSAAASSSGLLGTVAGAGGLSGSAPGGPFGTASASNSLLGAVTARAGLSGASWQLPNSTVPIVLFYWNSNRVVPVRVTSLSITETLYDEDLNPRHAQAQLSLRVLTPAELAAADPAAGTAVNLAVVAYIRTLTTRQQWAADNANVSAGSIVSKLPH